MKKIFSLFTSLSLSIVILTGCAQTKQYIPHPIGTQYNLSGMPADLVRVQVNDLRAERENSEQLVQGIKGQILSALSPEKINGNRSLYNLHIDIIEHRSFFTLGNWNAEGNAHRSNMWGYATAKAVSQDAYNVAIADMMSTLSAVSLRK